VSLEVFLEVSLGVFLRVFLEVSLRVFLEVSLRVFVGRECGTNRFLEKKECGTERGLLGSKRRRNVAQKEAFWALKEGENVAHTAVPRHAGRA